MAYAVKTKVNVDRTIGEIRKILDKAGADGFMFAEQGSMAYIVFKFETRAVRMYLRMPEPYKKDAPASKHKEWEQVRRSKWRSFLLCIKAKIEAIESGIETFDEAFLPHIILLNGQTVGDKVIHQIENLNTTPPAIMLGFVGHHHEKK